MQRFPRTDLAEQTADLVEGRGLFGEGRSGVFLAAPRRTGKSTFLRHDLAPELTKRGNEVVYVDLWSDRSRDPAELIDEAIGRAIERRLGFVAKATRAAGVERLDIAGVMKIDTSRIGEHDGVTLTEALRALRDVSDGPVVLMVDEAQHALVTERGENTMIALKSARDTLNSPDEVNLLLVMTGSDRDKLLRLVNTHASPFLGSTIRDLPLLGEDFVRFVVEHVERERTDLVPVDAAALTLAFTQLGHRPQWLERAIVDSLNPLSTREGRFEGRVLEIADERRTDRYGTLRASFVGLKPLERAVIWRLLDAGARYRAFDAEALSFYRHALETLEEDVVGVTRSSVQKALESLRRHEPPLVWKSARGEYAIDDVSMQSWYDSLHDAGGWPPIDRD